MVNVYFGSLEELLEVAKSEACPFRKGSTNSRTVDHSGWNGTKGFWQAVDLAVNGWPEGIAKIEKYTSMFTNLLGSKLQIDDYFYDVTGQDFDLDRVLRGEPESWLNSEPIHVDAPALHNVKIVVNIGCSSAVSEEAITLKGSAIAALVMLLERARRRVEVEIVQVDSTESKTTSANAYQFRLLLKSAGQDLDLGKLAFVLAHPSMRRRIGFSLNENQWPDCPANYGWPMDTVEPEGVLYCGRSFGAHWSVADSVKWIEDNLKKQGIELKEGNE